MGNTLLDFHQGSSDEEKDRLGLERLTVYLQESYQLAITADVLQESFLNPWLGDFHLRLEGKELDVAYYLNRALASFQVRLGIDECIAAMKIWFSEYKNQVVANPQAQLMLGTLKAGGKRVAVVSNCTLYEAIFKDVFEQVGISPYIDAYAFSFTYGVRKPHPKLYRQVLTELDLRVSEVAMVGDRIDTDLVGAKKLGMTTIWYNPINKPNVDDLRPDYEISDFRQIVEGMMDRHIDHNV